MLYNNMLRGFGNCGEMPASEDCSMRLKGVSTTGSLEVALDYSGVKQGKAATVLLSPRCLKRVQSSAFVVTLAKV